MARAQQPDSLRRVDLGAVEVEAERNSMGRLPELHGTVLTAGKKNEVVLVTALDADLATNNARQVFAKVPGVTVWENDGSGIQVSIAARGLSPNRSWEFNVRQNGYDICAEAFGYPEAYYSPPMEAVERIGVVRGAASLQFGPQFGGLVDYKLKQAVPGRKLAFEARQTIGSYGMHNAYNAAGGTVGKLGYYLFHQRRSADGWRANSRYNVSTAGASLTWTATRRLTLSMEYTRMDYVSQQPGGLTDQRFLDDPRESDRSRNWFNAPWNVGAITADLAITERARVSFKLFGTAAQRNSVGFLKPIDVPDTFNLALGSFAPRQVDRDAYANLGAELRALIGIGKGWLRGNLAFGARAYQGRTDRRQQGFGTTGATFDLAVTGGGFARELILTTGNIAFFAEQQIKLGDRLSIVPGARLEVIRSGIEGRNNASGSAIPSARMDRHVLLYGAGAEYAVTATIRAYANHSTAYRPVLFSEQAPSATTDIINPELRDANGHNSDLGIRGTVGRALAFDLGAFQLLYRDRVGTVQRDGRAFRTNVGTSLSQGVEAYLESDLLRLFAPHGRWGSLRVFASVAFISARYTAWNNPAIANDPVGAIAGKRVEHAPERIERYGLTYGRKRFSATAQLNSVGDAFTDAANTEAPNAAATVGRISAYQVVDLAAGWQATRMLELKLGVNNLGDAIYATRRAGGYPGPGLLPANGRSFWLTLVARI
jgi:Fe(3+) dicitrate transport protein